MPRSGRVLAAAVVVLLAAGYVAAVQAPPGPRSLRAFEPDRMAALEVQMWQAYYDKAKMRLFSLLVTMLREQYRYSWARAVGAGFHLARAAATFAEIRSDYEQVLPDLEAAYATARTWTGARFEPRAVAAAELAWWVARRTPGENDAATVGRRIAEEYSLLYEVPIERVERAALLRAQAAKLRDEGGAQADWTRVSELLRESFRELHAGLSR